MGVGTFLVFTVVISGTLAESLYELRFDNPDFTDGEGRLDIYNNSKWIPFSVNHFSMQVADLACKNLGFIYATNYATVGTLGYYESMNEDSTHMEIDCPSTAVSLSSCTYTLHNGYPHSTDVGLKCTTYKSSVRLYDFAGSTLGIRSGRLEYYVNQTWGTVCSSYFTSSLGMVACKQLGFSSYDRYEMASQSSNYHYQTFSSTTIWFSRFTSCLSGTNDLRQCAVGVGIRGSCSHNDDVILYCESGTSSPFYDIGEVRLTNQRGSDSNSGGSSYMNGRLEVYIRVSSSYRWTPFCYQNFDAYTADSACRQLGFDGVSEYDTVQNLGYSRGSGTYSVSTYNDCPYSSTGFYSCTFTTVSDCSHDNDVGLVCYESSYKYNALALGVGLGVGSLCLCTCLCMCIVMGVVIGGVAYHKSNSRKRMSRTPTVQYSRGSAGIGGAYRMTQEPEKNNSTNVHLPLSNTAGISHAVAMQNVGTALQSNTAGVSETVVAPQNVVADLHSNGGAESNMEAPGHDSGPSHNEYSVISHSDDDEQPLLP